MDYLALVEHGIAIVGTVVTVASAVCAMTVTPPPDTPLGRIYHAVEIAGIVVGKAKEIGVMPDDPRADKVGAVVVDAAKEALTKPTS